MFWDTGVPRDWASRRRMAALHMGNAADAGPSREQMPHSWQGIGGAHPDAVAHWRKKIEKREKLEEKYPELAGDDIQKATREALSDQG
ncbi:hypothetical protein [Kocuria massiliensis]|uniref:hypothetical protein n=1 Tax=Kocuria massiliensis TaxID=1926282 RepID=UPI0022B95ADC|nr:hypothetical protein [Kocuria massiliensis]